jgi:hypothetical protein
MLKMGGRGTAKDGTPVELMVIGLSHENLERLKEGKPIMCRATDFGCTADIQIIIFSGATEQEMTREFLSVIGPDTHITIDPRLRD